MWGIRGKDSSRGGAVTAASGKGPVTHITFVPSFCYGPLIMFSFMNESHFVTVWRSVTNFASEIDRCTDQIAAQMAFPPPGEATMFSQTACEQPVGCKACVKLFPAAQKAGGYHEKIE